MLSEKTHSEHTLKKKNSARKSRRDTGYHLNSSQPQTGVNNWVDNFEEQEYNNLMLGYLLILLNHIP